MGRSNRQAVENAAIDPGERLDLTIPRNASRVITVSVANPDGSVPAWFPGSTITAKAKTSYEANAVALTASVSNRDDVAGTFTLTYDGTQAKALGTDVVDLVHDCKVVPTGGGAPVRIFAGLMPLSKGVS